MAGKALGLQGHSRMICTIYIVHFVTEVKFYGKPLPRDELLFWKRPESG